MLAGLASPILAMFLGMLGLLLFAPASLFLLMAAGAPALMDDRNAGFPIVGKALRSTSRTGGCGGPDVSRTGAVGIAHRYRVRQRSIAAGTRWFCDLAAEHGKGGR